jgi:hypothetical protein
VRDIKRLGSNKEAVSLPGTSPVLSPPSIFPGVERDSLEGRVQNAYCFQFRMPCLLVSYQNVNISTYDTAGIGILYVFF